MRLCFSIIWAPAPLLATHRFDPISLPDGVGGGSLRREATIKTHPDKWQFGPNTQEGRHRSLKGQMENEVESEGDIQDVLPPPPSFETCHSETSLS